MESSVKNKAFVERVFTKAEIEYCMASAVPAQSFAGIYCAKEAAVKAVKQGFGHGISPRDIEVVHGELGAPRLRFYGGAVPYFAGCAADVSISHDGDYAIAVVQIL